MPSSGNKKTVVVAAEFSCAQLRYGLPNGGFEITSKTAVFLIIKMRIQKGADVALSEIYGGIQEVSPCPFFTVITLFRC